MRFPNGYKGVNKLFASEILNGAASILFFAASVIAAFTSQKTVNTAYLPAILIPMILVGVVGLLAFILQIVGLNQARKDNIRFRTAIVFVCIGVVAFNAAAFTGGTLGNIFSSINEVCSVLISVYIILGIYDLAEIMENANVMLHGKIALFSGTAVFAVAVIARIVPVFIPRTENVLDVICSVTELIAYIIFLIFLSKAMKMLSEKA